MSLTLIRGGRSESQPRRSVLMGKGAVINSDGSVAWEETEWQPNALADEGEGSVLNVWLRAQTNPSKYLGLLNQVSPGDTTTLATMTETDTVGVHGYTRPQILSADWAAPSLSSGDMASAAAEVTFGPASGASWTITHIFLGTASSGTSGLFLVYIAAASTTTIAIGQSYKYTLTQKAA